VRLPRGAAVYFRRPSGTRLTFFTLTRQWNWRAIVGRPSGAHLFHHACSVTPVPSHLFRHNWMYLPNWYNLPCWTMTFVTLPSGYLRPTIAAE
jgi:hypothetical protein